MYAESDSAQHTTLDDFGRMERSPMDQVAKIPQGSHVDDPQLTDKMRIHHTVN